MNEIILCNTLFPVLNGCDQCTAQEAFYHADRILDFHVLIYCLEGILYVSEEDSDYEIHAGELLFLKKGLHHFGKKKIAKGTKWCFIHFYLEEPDSLPPYVPEPGPLIQYEPVRSYITVEKKLSGLSESEIEHSILLFIDYFYSEDPMKKWKINEKLFDLLSLIAFHDKLPQNLSLSDKICEYLRKHLCEPFCAAALEQHFFLSYKYMSAVFKKETGQTMQKYHTELRIRKACKLLKATMLPVGSIGRELGYTDMLYFSRCFHQYTGLSPSAYRSQAFEKY